MPVDPRLWTDRRRARARLACAWWLLGSAVLLLTPVHAWTPLVGWAPILTLVVSPWLVMLALEPALPLRMLATCRPRRARRVDPAAPWHAQR